MEQRHVDARRANRLQERALRFQLRRRLMLRRTVAVHPQITWLAVCSKFNARLRLPRTIDRIRWTLHEHRRLQQLVSVSMQQSINRVVSKRAKAENAWQ